MMELVPDRCWTTQLVYPKRHALPRDCADLSQVTARDIRTRMNARSVEVFVDGLTRQPIDFNVHGEHPIVP